MGGVVSVTVAVEPPRSQGLSELSPCLSQKEPPQLGRNSKGNVHGLKGAPGTGSWATSFSTIILPRLTSVNTHEMVSPGGSVKEAVRGEMLVEPTLCPWLSVQITLRASHACPGSAWFTT